MVGHRNPAALNDPGSLIADPRVAEVRILRPQEIPVYVAEGLFDGLAAYFDGREDYWYAFAGDPTASLGGVWSSCSPDFGTAERVRRT